MKISIAPLFIKLLGAGSCRHKMWMQPTAKLSAECRHRDQKSLSAVCRRHPPPDTAARQARSLVERGRDARKLEMGSPQMGSPLVERGRDAQHIRGPAPANSAQRIIIAASEASLSTSP